MHKLISFLGDARGYKIARYKYGEKIIECKYSLNAILGLKPEIHIDKLYIVCTELSKSFVEELKEALSKVNFDLNKIEEVSIPDNKNSDEFWQCFEKISDVIQPEDEVSFDFTHGFRSIPIITSAAIHYVMRAKKGVKLQGVYYCCVEGPKEGPINGELIDITPFYEINEWADGVSRLVDNADTTKLVELANNPQYKSFSNLRNPRLRDALQTLSSCLQNIDINNVFAKAQDALKILGEGLAQATPSEAQLLKLAIEKFSTLAPSESNDSTHYDLNYLKIQLQIIKMLLEHKIYMQAFTAMREFIGSICMTRLESKKRNLSTKNGQRARHYAGEFTQMVEWGEKYKITIDEQEIKFSELRHYSSEDDSIKRFKTILPIFDSLEQIGVIAKLQEIGSSLRDIRNGFDHAWLNDRDKKILGQLEPEGERILKILSETVDLLSIDNQEALQ